MAKRAKKVKGLCKTCSNASSSYQGSNDGRPTATWCAAGYGKKLSKGYTVCPNYVEMTEK